MDSYSDQFKTLTDIFPVGRPEICLEEISGHLIFFFCFRAEIIIGGFVIKELSSDPPKCHVTYITRVDLKGKVIGFYETFVGCGDGVVVRALASHQCGPGSIPRSGVICGLSLLVLYSASRGFLRVLWFPLSSKTNI